MLLRQSDYNHTEHRIPAPYMRAQRKVSSPRQVFMACACSMRASILTSLTAFCWTRENAELRVRVEEASAPGTLAAQLEQYTEEAAAMQAEIVQLGDIIAAQEATATAEQELHARVSRPCICC